MLTLKQGKCILASCAEEVTIFRGERIINCNAVQSKEAQQKCWCRVRRWAFEECQVLPCINDSLGAVSDGRLIMVQP